MASVSPDPHHSQFVWLPEIIAKNKVSSVPSLCLTFPQRPGGSVVELGFRYKSSQVRIINRIWCKNMPNQRVEHDQLWKPLNTGTS